eukprot:gnl/Dysnectes_brevis/3262_a4080_1330.p1 GENE.gnl/Dysnectes_brevis/3262_a4080_1330~~gnl/Dysnectes_brevis/3262_a4080_1330.p1  ORF type:complete len:244 (+),score=92.31 gnl/Dysnectes_brevis/3262_a4080_1330:21-752(+)
MSNSGFDQHITVFSPEGRLYQVEYAFQAIKTADITSLSIRCSDGVVLLSKLPTSDRLTDASNTTFIHQMSKNCTALVTGRTADGRKVIARTRKEAVEFRSKWGYDCPADVLCRRMAEIFQLYTQEAWMRPYGVALTLAGVDAEQGPLLYRTDPAGSCLGFRAVSSGTKGAEVDAYLEQQVELWLKEGLPTCLEGVKVGLRGLQTVMGTGLTGDDVEVAVLTGDGERRLPSTEIDALLAEVAIE